MSEVTEPLSTRVLLGTLPRELMLLGSQTLRLALTEVQRAKSEVLVAAVGLAASAVAALVGVAVLASALVLIVVALGAPAWAAALGVGAILVVGSGIAGWTFYNRLRHAPLALPDTRASLSETMTWLKSEVKR
jgi:uncharacterized membrane protein YqjE